MTFHFRLQQIMSHLYEEQPRYFKYFQKEFANRCEQWATCYRIKSIVNTNMFVESFHRLLKVVYLENKQNRRVDKLLHVLIKIARNLIYEQLRKTEKGKTTHRRCDIHRRHKAAVEASDNCNILEVSKNEFKIQSLSNDTFYSVYVLKTSCDCKISCLGCGACMHMYDCSCMDFAIHYTVCKHIHLIHMKHSLTTNANTVAFEEANLVSQNDTSHLETSAVSTNDTTDELKNVTEDSEVHDESADTGTSQDSSFCSLEYFSKLLHQEKHNDLFTAKEKTEKILHEILAKVQSCNSIDTINTIQAHLNSALTVLKSLESYNTPQKQSLIPTSKPPANANHQKQPRFYSTKNKKKPAVQWSKPSLQEQQETLEQLDSIDVKVCAVCWKQDDDGCESEVGWVECSKCKIWIHKACTGNEVDEVESFYCSQCNV